MFAVLTGGLLLQNLICSECGDEFTLQSQLAIHMEEHRQELAGNRTHTCKACRKEFETPAQLKEHMKTHCRARWGPFLGLESSAVLEGRYIGPQLIRVLVLGGGVAAGR